VRESTGNSIQDLILAVNKFYVSPTSFLFNLLPKAGLL
jgi:hypothetical protein